MLAALPWSGSRIGIRVVLAIFVSLAIVMAGLAGTARPSRAAGADLLILSTSITKPAANGNPLSVEEQEAAALGLTVDIATPAQWAAMTTAQFAAYKAIILGDPTCQVGGTANTATAAALANKNVWGPAINGNIAIYGTDPTYHTEYGPFIGPRQVVHSSIDFAAHSGPGQTGAYITLSCYYHGTAANTPVPLLDGLETVPGQFTVTGVGCYNDAHIVATSSALTGLTDANLSNWSCSVHEAFDHWASDFTVLVIARNIGTSYTAPDGSVGTPYVLARGNISPGDIALSPPSQTACTGGSATVTAKVTSGGTPQSGVTVTFKVTSGPNAGLTGTGVTDASGNTSFTYSGTAAGTDSITGSFTDKSGHTQTSKPVTVTWTVCEPPISANGTTFSATEGQTFSGTVATVSDGDPTDKAAEYSATIAWGDSTTSTGTVTGPDGGPYNVNGSHAYAEEGTYSVKVHITDSDSSNTADAVSTANVGDANLTANCAMGPFVPQSYVGPTAAFSDANSGTHLEDFPSGNVTIMWGDGTTSNGTVAGANPYTVSGSHTYSSTGTFVVTTNIKDVGGATASATCAVTVFAFATSNGATFLIGDLEAVPYSLPGRSEYFWGSQWDQMNPMTGPSPSPSQMKGFAGFEDNLLGLPPACGGTWRTDPGNSSGPPATIPSIIAVIVTSNITQNGSDLSGDIVHIAIIKVDPGYGPSPGSPGTGTYLGNLC